MSAPRGGFTPGPWVVAEDDASNRPARGTRVVVRATDDTEFVLADCGAANNERGRANARLIAAAPDLYEALRAMVLNGEAHADCSRSLPSLPLARARAALAKAEGR